MVDPATVTAALATTVAGFVLFVLGGVLHIVSEERERREERDPAREHPDDTAEAATAPTPHTPHARGPAREPA